MVDSIASKYLTINLSTPKRQIPMFLHLLHLMVKNSTTYCRVAI